MDFIGLLTRHQVKQECWDARQRLAKWERKESIFMLFGKHAM